MGKPVRVTERRRSPKPMWQFPVRQREELMRLLLPWTGGNVWLGHHAFKPWDNAAVQCGRCWGWVDDWRHLGVRRSR